MTAGEGGSVTDAWTRTAMDAYTFLHRGRRAAGAAVREMFTGLVAFGTALLGLPLPPETSAVVPSPTRPDPASGGDGTGDPTVDRPEAAAPGRQPGPPLAGHPERLIPHVPATPVERQLWAQLR